MNKNLFEKVDIRMEATHVPSGAVKSDEEAEQYDAEIKAAGGIDLQLLGIGNNPDANITVPQTPDTSMTNILLDSAVDALDTTGDTALYDALYWALQRTNLKSGSRVVIAFTDGEENDSAYSQSDVELSLIHI